MARQADLAAHAVSDSQRDRACLLLDTLVPVVKSFPAEFGFESNVLALQVHGGYGYSSEYLPEAWLRDQKLNSIHEGTTGIQSLDLLGRKVLAREGEAMRALAEEIVGTVGRARDAGVDPAWSDALLRELERVVALTEKLGALGRSDSERMLLHSVDYLTLFSILAIGWQWLEIAGAAKRGLARPGAKDADFYRGKLQAAQYWTRTELPRVAQLAQLCESGEDSYARMQPGLVLTRTAHHEPSPWRATLVAWPAMRTQATPDPSDLRRPFERWLAGHWPEVQQLRVGEFEGTATGYSAQTLIAPLRYLREGVEQRERVVLRIENPGPPIYPPQAPGLDVEIEIQYRAMEAVGRASKLPLAPLLGYEADPGVLGQPFFVMGFVAGETPVLDPVYTRSGFFFDASPDERRRMIENGLRLLAELHTIDWRAAGLDWLVPPGVEPGALAQIDLWERFARQELRDRRNPLLDDAFAWLRAHQPGNLAPCLSWGDSRPGNIIWRDFEPVCVTDWENVAIAPRELDLGWWLMFDRTCHEAMDAERRARASPPSRSRPTSTPPARDCELADMHYFQVLAAARYAPIVVRVMNRYEELGLIPANHTVWLENPPMTVLRNLMDEV